MRVLLFAIAVLISATTFADEIYIFPTIWKPVRLPGWGSDASLTNPHPFPVTMNITAYPYDARSGICGHGTSLIAAQYGTYRLGLECLPNLYPMWATVVVASAPLIPTHDSHLYVEDPQFFRKEAARQSIDVGHGWLEPHVDHLIPEVVVHPTAVRANLFVINPNQTPLEVEYQRMLPTGSTPLHHFQLHAEAATRVALPVDLPNCFQGSDPRFGHDCRAALRIRANAKFYAVVSVIDNSTNFGSTRSPGQR